MKTIKSLTEAEIAELPKFPERWGWAKLEEISTKITDGEHFRPKTQSHGVYFLSAKDVKEDGVSFDEPLYISKETSQKALKRCNPERGDILIVSRGATVGRMCIVKTDTVFCLLGSVILIKVNEKINTAFLNYMLKSPNVNQKMISISGATAQQAIYLRDIKNIAVPLPPLPEQRAIVSKIELLFSELDNGIANLKLAQEQLKVYRQSVLDKTTKTEKFVPISTIINELGQGWSPKCHNEPSINNEEWGVIKTTAIQAGYFNESENKSLPADLEPRAKHELKAGDILITRAGPRVRVGVCCLVKKVRPRLINCDKAYRIRLKENLILPQFFECTLNSPKYTRMMENLKTGINDSGVNLTQNRFLDLEVPLPPLTEQHAIVQEIETRLSVCNKIEQDIKENLEKAEALRQSILKKAFEWKLLNERELAKVREAEDWEPAEVLMERIKAEKTGNWKKIS